MQETGNLNYKINPADIAESADDFNALSLKDKKRFLLECLDKNLLYIPVSEVNSEEYSLDAEDKRLTQEFYNKI
jgi:adenine-specific DNA-methyltransferase